MEIESKLDIGTTIWFLNAYVVKIICVAKVDKSGSPTIDLICISGALKLQEDNILFFTEFIIL